MRNSREPNVMSSIVVPAILSTSKSGFEEDLARIFQIPMISRIQIDVVDGNFAIPASWPYSSPGDLQMMLARAELLPQLERIEYEIDLMCLNADHASEAWLALGATRLTFHAEGLIDIPRFLASARKRYGDIVSFGLALNITSDLALIETVLDRIEYVQFMGIVRIGRQGQPFDRRVIERVRTFRRRYPRLPIQVDGGVSFENAQDLLALGVSNLVMGSALIRTNDPGEAIASLERSQFSHGI